MARTLIRMSSDFRTNAGRTAHVVGTVLAFLQLGLAIWLAIEWGMPYGSLTLLSGFCYATSTYVAGRIFRQIVDRRSTRRPE